MPRQIVAPLLGPVKGGRPGRELRGAGTMLHVAADGDRDARERDVAGQYARRLEPWVTGYPGQWLG